MRGHKSLQNADEVMHNLQYSSDLICNRDFFRQAQKKLDAGGGSLSVPEKHVHETDSHLGAFIV